MSRNKYPEETERRILEVSRRLFAEKGYEHTTIQDIVDALGMSKGAVYHHFKSKTDIYDRITDEYYGRQLWAQNLGALPGDTALERARSLFTFSYTDPEKQELDGLVPNMTADPRFLELTFRSTLSSSAPMLCSLMEAGNADGSMHIARPKEFAESFMLLVNMWVGNCAASKADFLEKLRFLQSFSDSMGFPVLNDALFSTAAAYYDAVMAHA